MHWNALQCDAGDNFELFNFSNEDYDELGKVRQEEPACRIRRKTETNHRIHSKQPVDPCWHFSFLQRRDSCSWFARAPQEERTQCGEFGEGGADAGENDEGDADADESDADADESDADANEGDADANESDADVGDR